MNVKRFSNGPVRDEWMFAHRASSWLDETVTVRAVLLNAAFLMACVILPVVLALAYLR